MKKKDKPFYNRLAEETLSMRFSTRRRMVNALYALSLSDPAWMCWVERNIPAKIYTLNMRQRDEILLLIEARARSFLLKPYGFIFGRHVGGFLFRHDWYFQENGALSPG